MPAERPPFGVKELRNAIPDHCFQHSYLTSFAYLAADLAAVVLLFCLSQYIDSTFTDQRFGEALGFVLRTAAWTVYWVCQGCVGTGLWVLGHECGHGGFAPHQLVNDTVGFVIHSALLVPYFSWAISHRRHHSNTGSLERDEVFVPAHANHDPAKAGQNPDDREDTLVNSLFRCLYIVITLTLGWPLYLFTNATGRPYPRKAAWGLPVNHFMPSSPIFQPKEGKLVLLSDAGVLAALAGLYLLGSSFGWAWLVKVYVVPYLIVNFWLVLITFLQHTDEQLPHYNGAEWDWVRGALATVDRDYGILNVIFHHIGDTHVAHHLFSNMPHYRAQEATEHLKKFLGKYYLYDDTPIHKALWRNFALVTAVEEKPKSGVFWF